MKNHLLLGNWNALCDSCGRKFKAFDLQKRWDGLMVCQEDFEQRHPQDLLKVQREKIAVPWARPYAAEDTYIGYICSIVEMGAKADSGSADCARAGQVFTNETADENTLFIYDDYRESIAGMAIAGYAISGTPYSLSPGA